MLIIENHTVELQQRKSIDMARVPDLELNQVTGEVIARGPGVGLPHRTQVGWLAIPTSLPEWSRHCPRSSTHASTFRAL